MLQLSEHALAMASVETSRIESRVLTHEIRTVGIIEFDESTLTNIAPRFDGFASRLFVNVSGVTIRKGDHLAEIYSPEVLLAQQELLLLLRSGETGALADVARRRLALLGLTSDQIQGLVERQELTDHVTLYSPVGGTVIEKSLVDGAAFKAGEVLYRIADLDTVWARLDVFELDLPWVAFGQRVRLTTDAHPGRVFEGRVTFLRPSVGNTTRTVSVPVVIENAGQALLPGMFVSATIEAQLGPDGRAASTGFEGSFSCPMHPQVVKDAPGACPTCGMPLEVIPGATAEHDDHVPAAPLPPDVPSYSCPMKCEGEKTYPEPGRCPVCKMKLTLDVAAVAPAATNRDTQAGSSPKVVAIPGTAVLDSGTRQLAYVEKERGLFEPRELTLGPKAGLYFPVIAGVVSGERVVTRGNFLIDSQFQITGHPSLLYPGGLASSPAHAHDAKSQPNVPRQPSESVPPPPVVPPAGKTGHQH